MRRSTKIHFTLDPEDWHAHGSESLWADPVSSATDDSNLFVLQNSPFFAMGVSYRDVVRAVRQTDGGYDFEKVVERGGHSTYVLLVPYEIGHFDGHWKQLAKLGCTYESGKVKLAIGMRQMFSVDVPPEADIRAVCTILADAEREGVWMCQESHMGHN